MKGSSKPLSIFPPFKLHCWFKLELFFVCWEIFRCKTSGPEYLEDLECLKSLNPSQETAVRRAASYNNSGFVSIHGPPGTGYLVAKESPVCSTSIGGVVFFVHFLRGGKWRPEDVPPLDSSGLKQSGFPSASKLIPHAEVRAKRCWRWSIPCICRIWVCMEVFSWAFDILDGLETTKISNQCLHSESWHSCADGPYATFSHSVEV